MAKRANRQTNPLLTNLFKIPNGTVYKPTGAIGQTGSFGGQTPAQPNPTGSGSMGFGGNASQMSLTRGAYRPNGNSTFFTTSVDPQSNIMDYLTGNVQENTGTQQAAAGGSLMGVPLSNPSPYVTGGGGNITAAGNNYWTGTNQAGLAGANNRATGLPPLPVLPTGMPANYSTLATSDPFTWGATPPPSTNTGPWNGDGRYNSQDINWQRGTSGFGQDFTRGRNRDLRNLRRDPKWGMRGGAVASVVSNEAASSGSMNWRFGAG